MENHILILVICGIILLLLGFFLFFNPLSRYFTMLPWGKKKKKELKETPGNPKICLVCSMTVLKGEFIKTVVFPPATENSIDRIMYIKGCNNCLVSGLHRKCPICKAGLTVDDFLVARMFERQFKKSHVHVLGCNRCRKV
jgi:formate hydrogenlyase subunit 3/multisubunit Na+/H+ antiporter MnhD subunit